MVGIFAGLGLFVFELRRRGIRRNLRLWTIAVACLLFGGIGARIGTWWQQLNPADNMPLVQWWQDGNRSILAGLVGAWIGVLIAKRLTGYRESTGDLFAAPVALAMAVGRIGCLLTELPGQPTGDQWGIVLTPEQAAMLGGVPGVGLQPTYLYEAIFQGVAFWWLWRNRDRLARPGDLFISYVTGYAIFRFGIEFVRANDQVWLGLTRPQWFLLATLPWLLWRASHIRRADQRESTKTRTGGAHDQPAT